MKILPNTIINFHEIHDRKWMENIFKFLQVRYNIVSLEDIYQYYYDKKKLKNACHITFDDGEVSFYDIVFPLLKKHRIPSSVFVSPKAIKECTNFWFQEIKDYNIEILKSIYCNLEQIPFKQVENIPIMALLKNSKIDFIWECIKVYREKTDTKQVPFKNINQTQLLEISNSGFVTIGAHTQNHPILKNESNEISLYEISSSVKELSELINKEIICFAFPNGAPDIDFNSREMNILKSLGIKLAFSTEARGFNQNDNMLKIPRNGITKGSLPFIYTKLLLGSNYHKIKRMINGKQENDLRLHYE